MREVEVKYLKEVLSRTIIDEDLFTIHLDNGKVLLGAIGENLINDDTFKLKTLYQTVVGLSFKINFSLKNGIEYTYHESVYNSFNPFSHPSHEEIMANYYIENALYRITTLWDILAQMYNVIHNVGSDPKWINYKNFFSNKFTDATGELKTSVDSINSYLEEVDDTTNPKEWKGNHKAIKEYRNKMVHRNAPDETTFSNFDTNLRMPPTLILRRVIEDYEKAIYYIKKAVSEYNES